MALTLANFRNSNRMPLWRAAVKMLAGVSNRDTYRDAANLLLRLPALGHGDRAREVATALIQKHPQRRAMVEELRRVTGSPP